MYIDNVNYIFLNVDDGSKSYMHYKHKSFLFCGIPVENKYYFSQSESCICLNNKMNSGILLVIVIEIYQYFIVALSNEGQHLLGFF